MAVSEWANALSRRETIPVRNIRIFRLTMHGRRRFKINIDPLPTRPHSEGNRVDCIKKSYRRRTDRSFLQDVPAREKNR